MDEKLEEIERLIGESSSLYDSLEEIERLLEEGEKEIAYTKAVLLQNVTKRKVMGYEESFPEAVSLVKEIFRFND